MSRKEKAIFVLSGQILESPFNPLPARSLHKAIERALRDRNVALTRRVVTLSASHSSEAATFLNAGFEIIPADDEDLQAAATISAALSETPLDEVVFMLGVPKPLQFLRSIAGKANRTLLTLEPLDDELAINLEGAFDFREILSKEGVNCDVLTSLKKVPPTKSVPSRANASASREEASKANVDLLCQTTPYDPEDYFKNCPEEWIAEVEKYLRQHDGYAPAIEVAQALDAKLPGFEHIFLKKNAIILNPICNPTYQYHAENVRYKKTTTRSFFYLAELKNLDFLTQDEPQPEPEPDPSDFLIATKEEWLPELEKYVLSRGGKCHAGEALGVLEERFKGISLFFTKNRDKFYKILRKTDVRLLEENSIPYFCHSSRPEVQPAEIPTGALEVGSARPEEPEFAAMEFKGFPDSGELVASFAQLANDADILRELTYLCVERAEYRSMGFDYTEELDAQEGEIVDRAKSQNLYLWPLEYRSAPTLTKDVYANFSTIYAQLADALRFLQKVAQAHESVGAPIDVNALQVAVDHQCLLKSALLEVAVDPIVDPIQRRAFELLTQYRQLYAPGAFLQHMKRDETLPLAAITTLRKRFEKVENAYRENLVKREQIAARERERDEILKQLAQRCAQIKEARHAEFDAEALAQTWMEVVAIVTTLCRDFKEPFSSLKLRELLYDVVDDFPEDVDPSDEFVSVREEIDLAKERDAKSEEEASGAAPEVETLAMRRVRKFFLGTKAVFVGGTPKKHIQERLADKLGFNEVLWESFTHGDSLERFKKPLQDPNVKVFIVYIPWCSHKHSREFAKLIQDYDKAVVRVSRGTSPAQIADAICEQTSVPEFNFEDNPELLRDDE